MCQIWKTHSMMEKNPLINAQNYNEFQNLLESDIAESYIDRDLQKKNRAKQMPFIIIERIHLLKPLTLKT